MNAVEVLLGAGFRDLRKVVFLVTLLAGLLVPAVAQQPHAPGEDWQQLIRDEVKQGNLDLALITVEQRLARNPADLEARGWRGRVLAWKGKWAEAENEYRLVLQRAPDDVDILIAVADVLLWERKLQPALETIDQARARSASDPDVLLRRARILRALGRMRDARAQFQEVLLLDPLNHQAKSELRGLAAEYKHELRLGNDVDTFNYTDAAQTQSIVLTSRWSRRWSTVLSSGIYQRFGEQAQKFGANSTFRISPSDWLGVGGASANDHGIVPKREASFEYGHGIRLHNPVIHGWEASYQQHWLWYTGAHVLMITLAQTYYLPQDCTWGVTVSGARSGFAQTGVDWLPSGSTRLTFPLHERLTANLSFAVGSEDYALVDQIGRFSAHTFAGGLRFRFVQNQDVSGYIARQNRSQNLSQTSYGVSYGIRF